MTEIYGFQYGSEAYGSGTTEDGTPLAFPVAPLDGAEDAALDTLICFTLALDVANPWTVEVDHGSGFELALTYNAGAVFEAGYDGPGSIVAVGSVFNVTIDKVDEFDPFDLVVIQILGQDNDGHPIEIA